MTAPTEARAATPDEYARNLYARFDRSGKARRNSMADALDFLFGVVAQDVIESYDLAPDSPIVQRLRDYRGPCSPYNQIAQELVEHAFRSISRG